MDRLAGCLGAGTGCNFIVCLTSPCVLSQLSPFCRAPVSPHSLFSLPSIHFCCVRVGVFLSDKLRGGSLCAGGCGIGMNICDIFGEECIAGLLVFAGLFCALGGTRGGGLRVSGIGQGGGM